MYALLWVLPLLGGVMINMGELLLGHLDASDEATMDSRTRKIKRAKNALIYICQNCKEK